MLRVGETKYGWGLIATEEIETGTKVLTDRPFILSPIGYVGVLARFFSLTLEELQFLETLHSNEAHLADDSEITKIVPRTSEFYDGLKWFWCVIKCNAHSLKEGLEVAAIYKHAVRINHSCDPNLTCTNENGVLTYTAIRDIKKGQEVLVSYLADLYAPRAARQLRLESDWLFKCRCKLCAETAEIDLRRVFKCPSQCSPDAVVHFDVTKKGKSDPWVCDSCQGVFPSDVIPAAMETTLTQSYFNLSKTSFAEKPNDWLNKVVCLHQACQLTLPKSHWLMVACSKLYSKFYAGIALSTEDKTAYEKLAFEHGLSFAVRASADSRAALMIDSVPWAYRLLQLALATDDWNALRTTAHKFYLVCKVLYGAEDPWMQLVEGVLEKMAAGEQISCSLDLPPPPMRTVVVPKSQHQWLEADLASYETIIGEKGTLPLSSVFSVTPWATISLPRLV
eukprot:Protomagalhaensia_wolfi_Nauph_80__1621@NODE_1_length_8074_cov_174_317237_g0_i0_p2_GENE_NODE_1_length_8074_cov_174_317237_g0_i0NODE_1_length_8074_cov_174_317237_g0_i0_p2_ORF_typecomplete_len450_score72_75SET/PF00856_28/4_3e16EGF_3/PF12947_7/0_0019EGF_3/PF12947_7/1_2e04THB/PF18362_1/0_15_NODE_1_length_8074_cov_174_317237_g0_i028724221